MGAYFIRRRSRTALYRRVLSSYVQKATEAGVTQAVFPEGGLSRDGLIGKPKLGILSYMIEGWRHDGRDVVFVPVSLNYDRVVEDRILVASERSAGRQFRATIPEGVRFSLRYVIRRLLGKVSRFGVAGVVFGRPVSLRDIAAEAPETVVQNLADRLMREIKSDLPVVAVPLVVASLVRRGAPSSTEEIAADARALADRVPSDTVMFDDSELDEAAVARQLDILVLRHILEKNGGRYSVFDHEIAAYYANSLLPHLGEEPTKSLKPAASE